jgi:hypothetical protein
MDSILILLLALGAAAVGYLYGLTQIPQPKPAKAGKKKRKKRFIPIRQDGCAICAERIKIAPPAHLHLSRPPHAQSQSKPPDADEQMNSPLDLFKIASARINTGNSKDAADKANEKGNQAAKDALASLSIKPGTGELDVGETLRSFFNRMQGAREKTAVPDVRANKPEPQEDDEEDEINDEDVIAATREAQAKKQEHQPINDGDNEKEEEISDDEDVIAAARAARARKQKAAVGQFGQSDAEDPPEDQLKFGKLKMTLDADARERFSGMGEQLTQRMGQEPEFLTLEGQQMTQVLGKIFAAFNSEMQENGSVDVLNTISDVVTATVEAEEAEQATESLLEDEEKEEKQDE